MAPEPIVRQPSQPTAPKQAPQLVRVAAEQSQCSSNNNDSDNHGPTAPGNSLVADCSGRAGVQTEASANADAKSNYSSRPPNLPDQAEPASRRRGSRMAPASATTIAVETAAAIPTSRSTEATSYDKTFPKSERSREERAQETSGGRPRGFAGAFGVRSMTSRARCAPERRRAAASLDPTTSASVAAAAEDIDDDAAADNKPTALGIGEPSSGSGDNKNNGLERRAGAAAVAAGALHSGSARPRRADLERRQRHKEAWRRNKVAPVDELFQDQASSAPLLPLRAGGGAESGPEEGGGGAGRGGAEENLLAGAVAGASGGKQNEWNKKARDADDLKRRLRLEARAPAFGSLSSSSSSRAPSPCSSRAESAGAASGRERRRLEQEESAAGSSETAAMLLLLSSSGVKMNEGVSAPAAAGRRQTSDCCLSGQRRRRTTTLVSSGCGAARTQSRSPSASPPTAGSAEQINHGLASDAYLVGRCRRAPTEATETRHSDGACLKSPASLAAVAPLEAEAPRAAASGGRAPNGLNNQPDKSGAAHGWPRQGQGGAGRGHCELGPSCCANINQAARAAHLASSPADCADEDLSMPVRAGELGARDCSPDSDASSVSAGGGLFPPWPLLRRAGLSRCSEAARSREDDLDDDENDDEDDSEAESSSSLSSSFPPRPKDLADEAAASSRSPVSASRAQELCSLGRINNLIRNLAASSGAAADEAEASAELVSNARTSELTTATAAANNLSTSVMPSRRRADSSQSTPPLTLTPPPSSRADVAAIGRAEWPNELGPQSIQAQSLKWPKARQQRQARSSLQIRRRFRAMGQLVSFVQTSRNLDGSPSSSSSSASPDERAAAGGSLERRSESQRAADSAAAAVERPALSDRRQHSPHQLATISGKMIDGNNTLGALPSASAPPAVANSKLALQLEAGCGAHQDSGRRHQRQAASRAAATGAGGGTAASRAANMEIKREKKAAKTLAIITGVFVCCWLPFFLNAIIMPVCGPSCTPSDLVLSVLLWLGYLNSLLNPIIYTIFSPDFRRAFRRLLCWPQLITFSGIATPATTSGQQTGKLAVGVW